MVEGQLAAPVRPTQVLHTFFRVLNFGIEKVLTTFSGFAFCGAQCLLLEMLIHARRTFRGMASVHLCGSVLFHAHSHFQEKRCDSLVFGISLRKLDHCRMVLVDGILVFGAWMQSGITIHHHYAGAASAPCTVA